MRLQVVQLIDQPRLSHQGKTSPNSMLDKDWATNPAMHPLSKSTQANASLPVRGQGHKPRSRLGSPPF